MKPGKTLSPALLILAVSPFASPALADSPHQRQAFFGELHLHTTHSFDAFVLGGSRVEPETAYRFARGKPIDYLGEPVRRDKPLDFMAITDHAENIGFFNQLDNPDSELSKSDIGREIAAKINAGNGMEALKQIGAYQFEGRPLPGPPAGKIGKSVWRRHIDTTNKYYEPGKFTTFIGYEWTAMAEGANLHRNIIFRGADAPDPFTSADSRDPEDLWHYLESVRGQGHEGLAIPHNANASNGLMYDWTTLDSKPIDEAYAQLRAANEPLNEITQNKGTSETHPVLSPNDEFAGFEIFDKMLTLPPRKSKVDGSYMRDGLGRGLVIKETAGVNPYKFGFVGSSDLHSGLSDSAESSYAGNYAIMNLGGGKADNAAARTILDVDTNSDPHTGTSATIASSGTLTGIWAQENTREALYDGLRRKEVFATSGTRLQLRLFGGWEFTAGIQSRDDWPQEAYRAGVPMGGDLAPKTDNAKAPSFLVWALKDPDSGNLDRAQIIKVWLENGEHREKVYDVAWSGDRQPDDTGKAPPVGDTVNLDTGAYTNSIGATSLQTVWTDPEFNPDQAAVYYLRVLEIPTPRWTTLLAIANDLPLPGNVSATIQERGWSSPIWYTPSTNN